MDLPSRAATSSPTAQHRPWIVALTIVSRLMVSTDGTSREPASRGARSGPRPCGHRLNLIAHDVIVAVRTAQGSARFAGQPPIRGLLARTGRREPACIPAATHGPSSDSRKPRGSHPGARGQVFKDSRWRSNLAMGPTWRLNGRIAPSGKPLRASSTTRSLYEPGILRQIRARSDHSRPSCCLRIGQRGRCPAAGRVCARCSSYGVPTSSWPAPPAERCTCSGQRVLAAGRNELGPWKPMSGAKASIRCGVGMPGPTISERSALTGTMGQHSGRGSWRHDGGMVSTGPELARAPMAVRIRPGAGLDLVFVTSIVR